MKENTISELRKHYSGLIKNSEERFVDYKNLISDLYKNKNSYRLEDFDWLMSNFKELKNFEEKTLKSLVNEWTELKKDYGI